MAAKILIVDDTPANVEAFQRILCSYIHDLEIRTAESGSECLEKIRAFKPDVVLLDVHMPGIDGFEACRVIKSTPETQNISVLMVSALMTAGRHRAAGLDGGADGYLCKPFDSAELVAQVRALIRLKRYEDDLRLQQDRLEQELQARTKKLRDSENNWRRVFEQAPDPVFIEDFNGNVIEANQAACRLHGMSRGELLTKNILDLVPPGERERVRALFPKWKQDALSSYEGVSYTKDGDRVPVEVRARHFDYFGTDAILFYMRDITERRRMEQEILQAQKLESVGLLAGGIAHDFNNILTGVIGNLSLIKMDMETDSPLRDSLCAAESAALRARVLTRQLLTFSKGGAPILKTASIRQLLETTPRFVLCGSRVVCELAIADDLCPVEIDVGQMSQVVENIVINAMQAMPEGGLVRVQAENVAVDHTVRFCCRQLKGERAVKIVISDQGCGIPESELNRVFDPYFTTKPEGTGLGLATCYAIIRKHGGGIKVDSKVGEGSRFTLYLPASSHPVADVGRTESDTLVGKGRVLVMDDEVDILNMLMQALPRLGYEVETTENGQQTLEAYEKAMREQRPFDAVILDLTIPGGMGGEETLKALDALDPDVNAIVSSGYAAGMTMGSPMRFGFKAAIEKPYSIPKLSQVLHAVIGNPRARQDA